MQTRLTTITGPMFGGKSELLIDTYIKKQEQGYTVLAYSFIGDVIASRAIEQPITARHLHPHHSASTTEDAMVEILVDIHLAKKQNERIAVFIDEVQFAPLSFTEILATLDNYDIEIFVAGLEHDYRHIRFETMEEVIFMTDILERTYSFCSVCQEHADHNQRLLGGEPATSDGPLFALDAAHGGENEFTYEPRCMNCYVGPVN